MRVELTSSGRGQLGDLADPTKYHEPLTLPPTADRGWLVAALRTMVLIRAAEEKLGEMVVQGRIRCPTHLAIGQEAPPVALARHLRPGDRLFGAHRSHGYFLAQGGSLPGLMAEVMGKVTGVSRGMGGSMHLLARECGVYGTVPILGTTIPIAVGAGLAARMSGREEVAVACFGDGATEEGVFHESLNLAANFRIPVLFLCENNLFSSHMHIELRQPGNAVSRYAVAHEIPADVVDGNDIVALDQVMREAIGGMRKGGGPRFIEAVTYRWRGHVGAAEDVDVGVRRKDDLALWKKRDPIRRLYDALVLAGLVAPHDQGEIWNAARAAVNLAWDQALGDPYPAADQLLDSVYGAAG